LSAGYGIGPSISPTVGPTDRFDRPATLREWTRPARHDAAERLAVLRLGQERQRGRQQVRRERSEGLGRLLDVLAVEPEQVARAIQGEKEDADLHLLDRVQAKLERRHDAEVAATSSQGPEQVGVLLFARHDEPAVGGHHVGREQVVHRQAQASRQVADPAAQGQDLRSPWSR